MWKENHKFNGRHSEDLKSGGREVSLLMISR
jgi:hypothetical protein